MPNDNIILNTQAGFEALTINNDQFNFDLYLKARNMRQLLKVAKKISAKTKQEKLSWIKQNRLLVNRWLDVFTEDSLSSLNNLRLDPESRQLSTEMVSNLRAALLEFDDLLRASKKIKG